MATKDGIYSACSPRSSMHFIARCYNICKALKRNSDPCPSNKVSAAVIISFRLKVGNLSIVFSVQETGGSLTWSDPENRVGDQENGSSGRTKTSGLHVPEEPGHFRVRTRPP
jgi:hypothetical protein